MGKLAFERSLQLPLLKRDPLPPPAAAPAARPLPSGAAPLSPEALDFLRGELSALVSLCSEPDEPPT